MRVLFSDYKGTSGMGPLYTPFAEVLRRSDIITLHAPLLPSTRNLIGAAEFAAMARKPLIINTARGGLVDEAALEQALRSGQISGAGFDVVTAEPPPADHVMMRLLDLPNFILTPHVAWASAGAMRTLAEELRANIDCWAQGAPRNLVA
jgi:glycerate dehydrogenase